MKVDSIAGVCIIPEGRVNKNICLTHGYAYEVTHIMDYELVLGYSRIHNLIPYFLTTYDGIIDVNSKTSYYNNFSKLDSTLKHNWYEIIVEGITRVCISNGTLTVYLMNRNCNQYKPIINKLRTRGLQVFTPIMGVSSYNIRKFLEREVMHMQNTVIKGLEGICEGEVGACSIINTTVAGITFIPGLNKVLKDIKIKNSPSQLSFKLVAEPENPYDKNAVRVEMSVDSLEWYRKVGYIP